MARRLRSHRNPAGPEALLPLALGLLVGGAAMWAYRRRAVGHLAPSGVLFHTAATWARAREAQAALRSMLGNPPWLVAIDTLPAWSLAVRVNRDDPAVRQAIPSDVLGVPVNVFVEPPPPPVAPSGGLLDMGGTLEQARAAKDELFRVLGHPPWLRGIGLAQAHPGWSVAVRVSCTDTAVRQAIPAQVLGIPVFVLAIGDVVAQDPGVPSRPTG